MTPVGSAPPLWVVGDVHGVPGKLRALLRGAGLIGEDAGWAGGAAHLVFLGDYLDRGPDGAEVVRLVRALEAQAPRAGGRVTALLGNHEVMLLGARRFGSRRRDPSGLREYWLENGGQPADLERLDDADLAWLAARPALARAGRWLLVHADSPLYLELGESVEAVNAAVRRRLGGDDPQAWAQLAGAFAARFAFAEPGGEALVTAMLSTFGGQRLAHGHTPVALLGGGWSSAGPGEPLTYRGGRCVALDSAMSSREDAGFMARLGPRGVEAVVALGQAAGPGLRALHFGA
ncbi:metallophosphoesterase [Deinococcus sp. RL]|uniref:metallophosphoesterase n=1 Tax=Deinococcus sp. RL TaxID=1489678 RepID=UPI0004D6BC47|nr:metallophosphoesterase [Deinococcus sp. RL]KEF35785.1 metallophosphoesterase [Deinococcus sp. RL]